MTKNENRCWPGYTPVPGKKPHEQGSCRPKAQSKLTPSEREFREKRREQLDKWEQEHRDKPRTAAQHVSAPKKAKPKSSPTKRAA